MTLPNPRSIIRQAVQQITPLDDLESQHQADTLAWIEGDAPLFRIAKPDTPPKHLVSYFILFDPVSTSIMLIDHVKAGLLLPTGGHVDPDEDPYDTVIREAREELAIDAEFTTTFGTQPVFITATTTRGYGEHTDVSLWYVIKGNPKQKLQFDTSEMSAVHWHTLDDVLEMDIVTLDPHMHRFVTKLKQLL